MAAKTALSGICEYRRGGEIYIVHPEVINIRDGWNARTDFSGEDELMAYIEANGVPGVLEVCKTEDGRLELVDGERRLRAVKRLKDEKNIEIEGIQITLVKRGTNEIEQYLSHMTRNEGKPFTPTEEAACYKRLIGWNLTVNQIHERTGKSVSHIRNRLELSNATPAVNEALSSGEITISQAQQIAKEPSVDGQNDALGKAGKPRSRNRLIIRWKDGRLKRTGIKGAACEPLENIISDELKQAVFDAGYDPATIRIIVERSNG